MAGGAVRASRWAVIRLALSNPNIARAEASIAIGTVAHVAWTATMLVVTYRLGPIYPGVYVFVTQFALAMGAPVFAALAGRFRRERVLAGAMIANGVGIALVIPILELHAASALLFFLAAVEGFTRAAPIALHDALLPWLANSPAQLVASNALFGLLDTTGVLVGAAVAATGLWLSGPPAVLTIIAILAVLGAGPLLAMRGIDTRVAAHDGSRILNELAGGIGVLRRLPNARAVVIVMAVAAALGGFEQSNAASVATDIVHIGANGTPVLVGAVAIGGLIGSYGSLSLNGRRLMSVPLAIGLLGCAVALCALTVTSAKALALALVSVAGIGVAYQAVCSRTLLQRNASGRSLDLLVGINALIGVSICGVSALCAGELNAAFGVRWSLRVAAGLAVLGAVYALWRLTRIERESPIDPEELDAIKNVQAFGPLSVAAANQLASALVSSQAADGDVIFRQGDPAEHMFLISSGVFEAAVDGERVRTMRQGDHFGEIALLFEAPRTATVRCLEAGTLWRLSREDFLRAMTGNSTTNAAMKAIADQRLAYAGEVDFSKRDKS